MYVLMTHLSINSLILLKIITQEQSYSPVPNLKGRGPISEGGWKKSNFRKILPPTTIKNRNGGTKVSH